MAQILIIDDDPALRAVLGEVCQRLGHNVSVAVDGCDGVAKAKAVPPDLVITDIVMPEKEGLETIRELRRDMPHVKIIAVSGGGQRVGSTDCLELAQFLGAERTLTKPFRFADLSRALDQVLGAP